MNYKDIPLTEEGDYDLDSFTNEQLNEYYWDHPESIPDDMFITFPWAYHE